MMRKPPLSCFPIQCRAGPSRRLPTSWCSGRCDASQGAHGPYKLCRSAGEVMHPLIKLAKDTVELYVREGKTLQVREEDLTPEMKEQAGVFVCLKVRDMLRG